MEVSALTSWWGTGMVHVELFSLFFPGPSAGEEDVYNVSMS